MRVIAEIKKASPSAGVMRDPFDPVAIAEDYAQHGADCLSILTDVDFFQGSIEYLRQVARIVKRPILRKDFIIDPVQVLEARLAGASAVLLIAECLTAGELADLVGEIRSLGMAPLVELHDAQNLEAVLASGTKLVGINNRDLRSFHTDLAHTLDLLDAIPKDRIVVSESGIRTRHDIERLSASGVQAILVGEAFMRAPSPGAKLAELLG
jgi:indole-3-glycerol phosphate synthase